MFHANTASSSARSAVVAVSTLAVLALSIACRSTPSAPAAKAVSADTWAVVDGREITRQQVDTAFKRVRDASQPMSAEEEMTAKLNLLNDLIVQDILIAKANALKLTVPDADLDTAFNNAKKNIPDDAFQQELGRRGVTAADMREGMRRELLTQKVVAQEIGANVAVSDQEVTDFFNANRAQFNVAEEAYRLAQIIVTPGRDGQVTNRTGDDAAAPEAAVAMVRVLMERLKGGADFRDLAVGYSEDPESASRGGDLGFVPVSQIKQSPPPLRDAVLNKAPGSVNVAAANGAYTLVLVVAHEPPGQRDLSMPAVREGIVNTLRGRKEQLLRAAYLTAAQDQAQVVNYLARRLVESKGKVPPAPLTPPAQK